MSWQAHRAVTYQSKQTNIALLRLLHVLAEGASATGAVDPAPNQDTLAELFGVSDRTIRSWINLLIDSGELIRTRRGRGDGNASAYQINLIMPEGGQITGSYEEEKPAFTSGNLEERLESLEETIANLQEVIAHILPVIENLQEEQETLTGRTGSVNRKRNSCKSADDPLRSIIDPEDIYIPPTPLYELPPEARPDYGYQEQLEEMAQAINSQVRDFYGVAVNEKKFKNAADALILQDETVETVKGFDAWWQTNGWYETGGKASLQHFLDHWDDYKKGLCLKKVAPNGRNGHHPNQLPAPSQGLVEIEPGVY